MNNIIVKRLNKELEFYNSLNYKYYIDVFSTIIDNDERLLLQVKTPNNEIFFNLIVPKDYPFKPYNYYSSDIIKTSNYYKYIENIYQYLNKNNMNKKIIEFFYNIYYQKKSKFLKLSNKDCFCCNSILCSNNWSPSYKISNIIDEVEEIEFINNYKNNYSDLEYIYNNNCITNLPDDLFIKILNYIIK